MSMRSITTWIFDSEEPLLLASRYASLEGTALLHSHHSSFLCVSSREKIALTAKKGCWEELESRLGPFDGQLSIPKWIGYLGYEIGAFADPELVLPHHRSQLPDALFYRPATIIHYDHISGLATLYGEEPPYSSEKRDLGSELKLIRCSDSHKSYLEKIAVIKEAIYEGDVYQVNLSQEFCLEGSCDPFSLFQKIYALNPSPFAVFINCGSFALVSSSPERFLCKKGDQVMSSPIKGTAPRGKNHEEDAANRKGLLESEKERAELLMIVDLVRNDLAKVAEVGSIKVKEMWKCEAYENVFHLLSTIEGTCKGNPPAIVRALFPGGSITGCPKLASMKMIHLLEGRARGVYTGSIGYFAGNGDFDFNIAIRTLIVHPKEIQIQLGGGIVIDSDPQKEYEETLHKGASLFKIMGTHELCLL